MAKSPSPHFTTKQAIGLTLFIAGLVFLFATVVSGFIHPVLLYTGVHKDGGWPMYIGYAIGMSIMFHFSFLLIGSGIIGMQDKNGATWKQIFNPDKAAGH